MLTKEQLLLRPKLPTEIVELPEFNGSVSVRAWTGADKDDWDQFNSKRGDDLHLWRASAVAASVVDENGDRMFDMNGDVQAIAEAWPASAIDRVWDAARRLNKLAAESIEAIEKN